MGFKLFILKDGKMLLIFSKLSIIIIIKNIVVDLAMGIIPLLVIYIVVSNIDKVISICGVLFR